MRGIFTLNIKIDDKYPLTHKTESTLEIQKLPIEGHID